MDREAWRATVHGVARVKHILATKPPPTTHHVYSEHLACLGDILSHSEMLPCLAGQNLSLLMAEETGRSSILGNRILKLEWREIQSSPYVCSSSGTPTQKLHLKLFCHILLVIHHCSQLNTGMARFQDQLYSQRICYLRHHCALQEGKHLSTLITCCFQTRVILCKLQLNIYNSFKSGKRDMVLKHNCDVGFTGFFFISKYLQSCSVDTRVETT